jgi:hypothetical protein
MEAKSAEFAEARKEIYLPQAASEAAPQAAAE